MERNERGTIFKWTRKRVVLMNTSAHDVNSILLLSGNTLQRKRKRIIYSYLRNCCNQRTLCNRIRIPFTKPVKPDEETFPAVESELTNAEVLVSSEDGHIRYDFP